MIKKNSKIFVAGHNGLVGSAVVRMLKNKGYTNILTVKKKKLDLTNQRKTFEFLKKQKPKFIFMCAAKVGGILANDRYKADFIYQNLEIQNNVIHGAFKNNIKELIFLGSSCIYPAISKQPIKEKYLLDGKLEKTNEPYGIAKIAGIKLCESYNFQYKTNYKCLMPTNLYGENDNYDKNSSHFVAALIKKVSKINSQKKKILTLWGTGKVKREIMHVDDLAEACVYFMNKKTKESLINIGVGKDYTINEYAKRLLKILNIKAKIKHDLTKPDGIRRKLLDISLAKKYGWKPKVELNDGLISVYRKFLKTNC